MRSTMSQSVGRPAPRSIEPTDRAVADRLEHAVRIAKRSTALTRWHFAQGSGQRGDHEPKADGSPVTIADRACERYLRDAIAQRFPADGVLGEEYGQTEGTSEYRWILDPIDGTRSFIQGVPLWGTLIAVERLGMGAPRASTNPTGAEPIIGVIIMPELGEMVYGSIGGGAWHVRDVLMPPPRSDPDDTGLAQEHERSGAHAERATAARVSATSDWARACVCTTGLEYWAQTGNPEDYVRLARSVGVLRGWSDCYAHVLLCTGRVDAVVEPVLKPWDIAASIPILRELGGRWRTFEGLESAHHGGGWAWNGRLGSGA